MTEMFKGHALARRLNVETLVMLQAMTRPAVLALLNDPSSAAAAAYAARIADFAGLLGVDVRLVPYDTMALVQKLAKDPLIDSILALTPLPSSLDPTAITNTIGPALDAEGQHPLNLGALATGRGDIWQPTAKAAYLCARELAGDLKGRQVAIVGASPRVGRPLALLMMNAGATISVANEFTVNLPDVTRAAEILISATGVAGLITADHIAEGAILLDVGIISTSNGLVGDIDRASVAGRASILSHVPDGVGPVTTACLMRNVARLANTREKGM